VIDPKRTKVRAKLQRLARYLDGRTPVGWGFALMMFPFGSAPDRTAEWVSNADRAEMPRLLREFAAHLERNPEVAP